MTGLTKKHFKEIADIININAFDKEEVTPKENIIKLTEDLSEYFKTENPLFDKEKFLKACLK